MINVLFLGNSVLCLPTELLQVLGLMSLQQIQWALWQAPSVSASHLYSLHNHTLPEYALSHGLAEAGRRWLALLRPERLSYCHECTKGGWVVIAAETGPLAVILLRTHHTHTDAHPWKCEKGPIYWKHQDDRHLRNNTSSSPCLRQLEPHTLWAWTTVDWEFFCS